MYLIVGINHPRVVGVDKKTGKAYDFDPENADSYRSPKTQKERTACVAVALEYYNACIPTAVAIGDFGLLPISEVDTEDLGVLMAKQSLLLEKIKARRCRFCDDWFIPHDKQQDVCKKEACQRRRKAEKAYNYYLKKRAKK